MAIFGRKAEGLTKRLEFARQAYQEVNAAIRHQDNKIGHLLVSIAFLTAAALAAANLGEAKYLGVEFAVRPDLQLGLISLATFMVLILAAASLLLMALGAATKLQGTGRKVCR